MQYSIECQLNLINEIKGPSLVNFFSNFLSGNFSGQFCGTAIFVRGILSGFSVR